MLLPDLLYPGQPIPPGYLDTLSDDDDDDHGILSQVHYTEAGEMIHHSLDQPRPSARSPPTPTFIEDPEIPPQNQSIAIVSPSVQLPSTPDMACVDGIPLDSAAPDHSESPESPSKSTPNSKATKIKIIPVNNVNEGFDLLTEVKGLTRVNQRLQELLQAEIHAKDMMCISLLQKVRTHVEQENKAYRLVGELETSHTEQIRRQEMQSWEKITALEAQHQEETIGLLNGSDVAEQHLAENIALQKLEDHCWALIQELTHMEQQFSLAVQAAFPEEFGRRIEKDAETILSLKSMLAKTKLKIQEECLELERELRSERRWTAYERSTIFSESASEVLQLEGERLRLRESLVALTARLREAQTRLDAKDEAITILEDHRASLASQVSDEAYNYMDLLDDNNPDSELADLQEQCARLRTSIQEKDRKLEDAKLAALALRAELRYYNSPPSTLSTSSGSSTSVQHPHQRPVTPTPYSPRRQSDRIMKKSKIKSPYTPSLLGTRPTPPTTPSGEKRSVLLTKVRTAMNHVLGIEIDREIVEAVDHGHQLTEDEHTAYEEHRTSDIIKDLSANNVLKPYWGEINCEYNRVLAAVFTYHFIATHSAHTDDHNIIANHFLKRLQRLKRFLA